MAKKPLLFVDTNIFLDFYRAGGEAGLTLLNHIESVSDLLIMTDQIEMEFLNNRQGVISSALANLKAPAVPAFTPAYLADTKTAAGIDQNFKQIRKRIEVMKERFARILKDPSSNDPVFKSFKRIIANSFRNLKFAEPEKKKQIFDFAMQRYQRGFPPRKKQDHSVGDAINWEWILDCAQTLSADVLIVSRDGDFGASLDKTFYLNDWLSQEFKERVSMKRKAELTLSLSQALKKLNVKVTAAEEKEEQSIIEQKAVPALPVRPAPIDFPDFHEKEVPPFWGEVIKRVGSISQFSRSYLLEAERVLHHDNTLFVELPSTDHIGLIDNQRNRTMLQTVLRDIGIGDTEKIVFRSCVEKSPSVIAIEQDQPPPTEDDDVPF